MGSVVDVLTVAMGSGGVGTALASSIRTWLADRKGDVAIKITAGDRVIEVQAHAGKQDEVKSIIERFLDDFASESKTGPGTSSKSDKTPRAGNGGRSVVEQDEGS